MITSRSKGEHWTGAGTGVRVRVGVGVLDAVGVSVTLGVGVLVLDGEGDGDIVAVSVAVGVGDFVVVGVLVEVFVFVGVLVCILVGVFVGVVDSIKSSRAGIEGEMADGPAWSARSTLELGSVNSISIPCIKWRIFSESNKRIIPPTHATIMIIPTIATQA